MRILYSTLPSARSQALDCSWKTLEFPKCKISVSAFQEVLHVDTFTHLNGLTPVESDVWFTVSVPARWSHLLLLEPSMPFKGQSNPNLSDGRCPCRCHCYDGLSSSVGKVSFGQLRFSRPAHVQPDNASGAWGRPLIFIVRLSVSGFFSVKLGNSWRFVYSSIDEKKSSSMDKMWHFM